ncbi:hypothetical protein BUH_5804 [Burkholderia pseudomallei Pakistan 9]|uniref:Uncharacterized protein n=1 Tax=Burkholderia pseudomallei 1710a TaxID=320371 RepID=A0A0E1VX80_BURPE|nr:hypothetical protein BUH_5804 [Burkholderia pseudomallei Pakistan 9]EET04774.1 hypothetical protein BURPS1710A_A0642 [Burkholderia pseudomallei 1710a]
MSGRAIARRVGRRATRRPRAFTLAASVAGSAGIGPAAAAG